MIATLKQEINEVLKKSGYDHFYGSSSVDTFPYIRYTLGDHFSRRLSNKKELKNIWYQIDVFSQVPFDVEDDSTVLALVERELEAKGLITTDWIEVISENNTTRHPNYHYILEVRK